MTMASSLLPGNPKRIDSCICNASLIFKPVIDCHHLAQLFQKSLLLLQSMNTMCYAVCVVAICTFTIWFYQYIFEPSIAR